MPRAFVAEGELLSRIHEFTSSELNPNTAISSDFPLILVIPS